VVTLGFAQRTHDILSPRSAARWPKDRPIPVVSALDPLIDGVSLLDTVRTRLPRFPMVSPLWTDSPALAEFHVRALLGEGPSDLHQNDPRDHVALFMCPHCAAGGCGVLSARLVRDQDHVHWTDVGRGWPNLDGLGPFTFARDQYDDAVRSLLGTS
jgi:hypothetical protein